MKNDMEKHKAACKTFLEEQEYAVIASASAESVPSVAVVTYLIDDDWNIYFFTRKSTTKARNISENKAVSLVVGVGPAPMSAQINGRAEKLDEKENDYWMDEFLVRRDGFYATFLKLEGFDFEGYVVRPERIRWLNIDSDTKKESQIEISFP